MVMFWKCGRDFKFLSGKVLQFTPNQEGRALKREG
jgi:hypothetical protein